MFSNRINIRYEEKPCYDILLEKDYSALAKEIEKLELRNRKLCIVTDSKVGPLYASKVEACLKDTVGKIVIFTFPAGEASKNLKTVEELYEFLIQEGFDRNDVLGALGGGVVGDLTGYAAATFLRGLRFFQMPTSLLAMVDSSIGGKTGVDFKAYKNMVGAFYMPQFVYMNISVLNSLTRREYFSGYGEIIKHGFIRDDELTKWLINNKQKLAAKDADALLETVYRSLLVKKEIVEKDPKEKGERALLNFGHTIGHSVEKLMNFSLLHGECVAIGMVAAAQISLSRGMITKQDFEQVCNLIQAYQLPCGIANSEISVDEIVDATGKDKKMDAGKIKFILLQKPGNAIIDSTVTKEEMADAAIAITA